MYIQYKDFIHTFLKWYTWFRHQLKLHPGAQFANRILAIIRHVNTITLQRKIQ